MKSFILSTDSTYDMSTTYAKEKQVYIAYLNYTMDGTVYHKDNSLNSHDFYQKMKDGFVSTTSQVAPGTYVDLFEEIIGQNPGKDLLHVSFSSALSGSYQSALIAAEEMRGKYPDISLYVVDTRAASAGLGLVVHYVLKMREEGKSAEEISDWITAHRDEFVHLFTVEDLVYLQRGGRVSKTAAFVATMLNIKPVLHVDNEGRLIPLEKVRGRKASLDRLVELMGEQIEGYDFSNEIFFVSQAACKEDAEYICKEIQDRYGIAEYIISDVGPVIGSHTGPGVVALFFKGKHK